MKDKAAVMDKVKKAAREPKNGRLVIVSFGAMPEDLDRWTRAAKAIDRSLAWYLRSRLLAADARDDEIVARASERQDA